MKSSHSEIDDGIATANETLNHRDCLGSAPSFLLIQQFPAFRQVRKSLILFRVPNLQVPKGLIPCLGGHDIAFIYPLIPCKGSCVSLKQGVPKGVFWGGAEFLDSRSRWQQMKDKEEP